MTTPTRICITCGKTMVNVGKSFVCPTARTEAKRVSAARRAALAADAYAIDPSCGF